MSLETARKVLETEREALDALLKRLAGNAGAQFEQAVELLFACQGRVVVTGMGKSGIIGRKIAATLSSTGTPAFFLHPAEAVHGDLGMLVKGDVLVALSYGGETEEIVNLLPTIKRLGVPLLLFSGAAKSTLGKAADVVLDVSVPREACSLNLAPTASTTAMLALGDALAIALLERRGFKEEDFAELHPGGRLGKKLQRVEHLMHKGRAIPRVNVSTPMPDVIYEMSKKGLGMTSVVEDSGPSTSPLDSARGTLGASRPAAAGRLVGIITDGDLRRLMQRRKKEVLDLKAGECMTKNPVTISRHELATTALRLMEERKITSVVVVDPASGGVEGVIHVHDLWTTQMF